MDGQARDQMRWSRSRPGVMTNPACDAFYGVRPLAPVRRERDVAGGSNVPNCRRQTWKLLPPKTSQQHTPDVLANASVRTSDAYLAALDAWKKSPWIVFAARRAPWRGSRTLSWTSKSSWSIGDLKMYVKGRSWKSGYEVGNAGRGVRIVR